MERILMRIRKNNRGQMRVVETILASFVLVGALAFLNIFAVNPRSATYEVGDLEKLGYNVLHNLDEQRLLGRLVYNSAEWSANFTNAIRVCLPSIVYFDLTIRCLNGSVLNGNVPIRYGDARVFSNSNATASVTYTLIGYSTNAQANYNPRVLVLLLVRG